jgi:hypothetical protein
MTENEPGVQLHTVSVSWDKNDRDGFGVYTV